MFSPETILNMIGPDTVNDMVKQHAPPLLRSMVEFMVQRAMTDRAMEGKDPGRRHTVELAPEGELVLVSVHADLVNDMDGLTFRREAIGTYNLNAMLAELDLKALMK